MKIIKKITEIESQFNLGITVGNFDGVHKGHQFLLSELKQRCIKDGNKLVVITFNPHPKIILSPSKKNFLLTSYEDKLEILNELEVDYCLELTFNRDFSTQSPSDFLDNEILAHPNVKHLFLGHDFTFGANKEGNYKFTQNYCSGKGVLVDKLPCLEEFEVSSSLIREEILSGNMKNAAILLGRSFFMDGAVIKGEGRGKKIGFPTANIQLSKDIITPCNGVYITRTKMKNMTYQSVTNIGLNPTFNDTKKINIETHILDFDCDIYGETITVSFEEKIRNEVKFSSVNELIKQIGADVKVAKAYFSK